jgi:DNA-binding LacI/PurR family transcriptional regulator
MTAVELAKELNLSRTTVSVVLNGRAERYGLSPRTVERVLKAARRHNYRPDPVARQLMGMRSNVVGILADSSKLVDPRFIEMMELRAAEKHLRFFVGYAASDVERVREYLDDFRGRRVDAVISLSHNHPAYRGRVLDELLKMDRVLFYEKPDSRVRDPWYVEVDYYEMGRLAAQHLIDRGCRRIGLMGLDESFFEVLSQRRRGFQETLRKAGLDAGEELLWGVDPQRSLHWIEPPSEEDADRVIEEMVVRQKVDGLFAINDLYVARLMFALRKRGLRVPQDVALVGADNMDISTLVEPRITTIDVQIDVMAQVTVDALFEMLHSTPGQDGSSDQKNGNGFDGSPGKSTSTRRGRGVSVKPRLVVRESA